MGKRIISVAKAMKPHLDAALMAAAGLAGADAYNYVKAHLTKKNVSYDVHDDPDDVPAGRVYSDHR